MHLVLLGHSILQQARKQVAMMNKLFEIDLLAILRLVPCAIKTLKNYLAKARARLLDHLFSHHTTPPKRKPASLLNILQWAIFNDCFQACNNRASAAEVRRPQHLNLPQTHHNPTKHRAGGLRLTPT
jgi:hypothetical protein